MLFKIIFIYRAKVFTINIHFYNFISDQLYL